MTDTVLVNNYQSLAADTVEVIYTSPSNGLGTKIKAFTATNNTDSAKSYKAYIYDSSGALVSAIIPITDIARDRYDVGAAAVNQVIPKGGTLRVESSAIASINFYVTGVEQSV